VATGDFGPGRMPPDMFKNCNEEIKRKKEQTIRNQNRQISWICNRIRIRDRDSPNDKATIRALVGSLIHHLL
jgi:hypothetical protein